MGAFILFIVGIVFGAVIGALIVEHRVKEVYKKVSDLEQAKLLSEECYRDAVRENYPTKKSYDAEVGRVHDHRYGYIEGFRAALHLFKENFYIE